MKSFIRLFFIVKTLRQYGIDDLFPASLWPKGWAWIRPYFKGNQFPHLSRGERLRLALETLGPIFIKFGQLLSTRPDLLPPDLMTELSKLQDNVKPFDEQQSIQIIQTALGANVQQLFLHFQATPMASASIAQVHAAQLHSGELVVVKVVRPGLTLVIEQDLQWMMRLAQWIETYSQDGTRLKPVQVIEDYRNTILDELDLMREAANATQLKRHFEQSPLLYVPKIYWAYARPNVMVMERIEGVQVTDVAQLKAAGVNIALLAERGVEIFFKHVFDHNFFHADMHPGNVYVDICQPESPKYIALDMAIMGSLSREDQYYLARNMLAMFRRDYHQVAQLHVLSGWVPKNTSVPAFEAAIRTVCEPIFAKPIKDISFGDALIKLFQTARRFNMPIQPQLVLLQKTLVNIEGLGRQLYPDLDLWQTAHPFLERWLKQRFHPKQLYRELRRQAPEWMEKFPEIPHLIYSQFKQQQAQLPDQTLNKKRPIKSKLQQGLGVLVMGTGFLVYSSEVWVAVMLWVIGLALWVLNV